MSKLIDFGDYWWSKLKAYRDSGNMIASGVKCPDCNKELWVMKKKFKGYGKSNLKKITWELVTDLEHSDLTSSAICENGHINEL